jgi:hypothetical protein
MTPDLSPNAQGKIMSDQNVSQHSLEMSRLAEADVECLNDLVSWLYQYAFAVQNYGDGELEMEKVRSKAIDAIKRISNYL